MNIHRLLSEIKALTTTVETVQSQLKDLQVRLVFELNEAPLLEECRELLKTSTRASAIQHYRDKTGCGLLDAFNVINSLE